MKIVRVALARLSGMFDRDSRDRDLAEELASHMELHVDDNLRGGMTPEEAVRAAKIRLGSIESIKEGVRERRGFPVLQSVLQDIRYALRGMGRSPGFTTVAVMTLAVAIGINAGVFTIAGTVLFGGYPKVDPDNRIFYTSVGLISNREFQDWNAQAKSFSGMAGVEDGGLRLVLQDDSGNSETCDTTEHQCVPGTESAADRREGFCAFRWSAGSAFRGLTQLRLLGEAVRQGPLRNRKVIPACRQACYRHRGDAAGVRFPNSPCGSLDSSCSGV
jgi:hypothetical protein